MPTVHRVQRASIGVVTRSLHRTDVMSLCSHVTAIYANIRHKDSQCVQGGVQDGADTVWM